MDLERLAEMEKAATAGEWYMIHTPGYLMVGQPASGDYRNEPPVTIATTWHTEEVATFWNYMMVPSATAALIVALRNAAPELLAAARRAGEAEALLHELTDKGAGYAVDETCWHCWKYSDYNAKNDGHTESCTYIRARAFLDSRPT